MHMVTQGMAVVPNLLCDGGSVILSAAGSHPDNFPTLLHATLLRLVVYYITPYICSLPTLTHMPGTAADVLAKAIHAGAVRQSPHGLWLPANDARDGQLFSVHGVDCVVVHDESSTSTGVAVAVNVGSLHNQPELLGLAHLLEHVVFLGSHDYPDTSDTLMKYCSAHGGRSNAYTAANVRTAAVRRPPPVATAGHHTTARLWLLSAAHRLRCTT